MPGCATRLLVASVLFWSAGGCGGKATAATDQSARLADGGVLEPDSGVGKAGAGGAGDRGGGQGTGGSSGSSGDADSCSLPVGGLAPGCPMVLAPPCAEASGEYYFPTFQCSLPVEGMLWSDPELLSYVDVVFLVDEAIAGRLLRVAGVEQCDTTGNGWYYDDPLDPRAIHICPNACECAKGAQRRFGIAKGCWSNAAPGVVSAEIACPRCAATRPKSCPTALSGYGYPAAKCNFPFELGYDPLKTNLKYVQNLSVAGAEEPWDGYLTFVPSLADCDKVEEGWTLDLSTEPATVRVCPSACSCAKVNAAELLIESGCDRRELGGS
jgi:hypothetical protein